MHKVSLAVKPGLIIILEIKNIAINSIGNINNSVSEPIEGDDAPIAIKDTHTIEL